MGKSEFIKSIRAQLNLSRHQLAFIMGCHYMSITHYEQGRTEPNRAFMLALNYIYENRHQLAQIIDLEDNELFDLYKPIKLCTKCQQPLNSKVKKIKKKPRH